VTEPAPHRRSEWLFVRALALVYAIAFASFGWQSMGLVGSSGIAPVSGNLARASQALGSAAWTAVPTLFWLSSSDAAIRAVCLAGLACAVLAFTGFYWRAALVCAFVLYLSLVSAAPDFLSFQWDYLLLEAGFLAIFLALSPAVPWLFRCLLFRLMFFSGFVKLASGDSTWRSLTALTVHYQTQPIPTPLAWYTHQLPLWFQRASCAGVFFVELAAPFLIFGPRRVRHTAAVLLISLQLLIALTGNYAFFNLLTIALCLFLIGEELPARALPDPRLPAPARRTLALSLSVLIGTLSLLEVAGSLRATIPIPGRTLLSAAAPFGIVNSYGLFANMTTTRPEIVIEGSSDGIVWRAYEFRYKPGRRDRHPPWVAPYQPRLDWQMWFAALGGWRENPWILRFAVRLLEGKPEVLALLETNPFPHAPPRLVRAQLYDYRFTTWGSRDWWTRTLTGDYFPPVSREQLAYFTAQDLPLIANAAGFEFVPE
jgi:hypothetical protein